MLSEAGTQLGATIVNSFRSEEDLDKKREQRAAAIR